MAGCGPFSPRPLSVRSRTGTILGQTRPARSISSCVSSFCAILAYNVPDALCFLRTCSQTRIPSAIWGSTRSLQESFSSTHLYLLFRICIALLCRSMLPSRKMTKCLADGHWYLVALQRLRGPFTSLQLLEPKQRYLRIAQSCIGAKPKRPVKELC